MYIHSYLVQSYLSSWVVQCILTSLQDGLTAVHLAAVGGHSSLVRELVDIHHANVHQLTEVYTFTMCKLFHHTAVMGMTDILCFSNSESHYLCAGFLKVP